MEYIEIAFNIVLGIMTVLAFSLFIISILSYRRSENKKMLFLGGAFISFFVKGLWMTYLLFTEPLEQYLWLPVLILDTAILIIFYCSTLKR